MDGLGEPVAGVAVGDCVAVCVAEEVGPGVGLGLRIWPPPATAD